jgi:hypothetical protein
MFKARLFDITKVVVNIVASAVSATALVTSFHGIYFGSFILIYVSLGNTLPLVSKK